MDFSVKEISAVRVIQRVDRDGLFPEIPNGKIAIFIGAYSRMTAELTQQIDQFCAAHDAVVLCDHTSEYNGKYRVLAALYAAQEQFDPKLLQVDLLIHIGEISGEYYTIGSLRPKMVWRVNEDGEMRDRFNRLTHVFQMSVLHFFKHYTPQEFEPKKSYLSEFERINSELHAQMPDLPFSNIWIASRMAGKIPADSVVHLGILQSLRAWNFFKADPTVRFHSNVGGFGIDGCVSTLVGASLVSSDRLYYGIVGDLAFFYDLNVIGNRHLGNNIRILVINNGKGVEFRTYKHRASMFGEDTDRYIAAAGHNGNQSKSLIKDLAKNFGFLYLTANDKASFEAKMATFIEPLTAESHPMIFEVFTDTEDEVQSLALLRHIFEDKQYEFKTKLKEKIVSAVGLDTIKTIKKVLR